MSEKIRRPSDCRCKACGGRIGRFEKAVYLVKQSEEVEWYHTTCEVDKATRVGCKFAGVSLNGRM